MDTRAKIEAFLKRTGLTYCEICSTLRKFDPKKNAVCKTCIYNPSWKDNFELDPVTEKIMEAIQWQDD